MKLPEEIKRLACGQGAPTDSLVYEALVRDCAKVCEQLIQDTNYEYRALDGAAKAILARYGLTKEPKS